MKKIKVLACIALGLTAAVGIAKAEKIPELKIPVVVVDKKTHQTHLTNYEDGRLRIVRTFRTTLGEKIGDKIWEGDKKTPEGIYEFLFRARAPQLKPKFGPLAIYVSYPNSMDRVGQKTGFDILIHGTDDPARLEKQFDSLGCVVLDNANVQIVSDNVELKDTKVIITRDWSALQNTPRLEKARTFFNRWITAWSNKDMTTYIDSYADEFRSDGMNKVAFGKFKESLKNRYETITVKAENVRYYFHEKYDLVTYDQVYSSTLPGGRPAFSNRSKKRLYLQERNDEYRIVVEENVR
jgi:murein L,D-transpeptidase YafK